MFIRKLSVLFSGTVLAQLIPLALLPILARSYTPAQFAEYGVFLYMSLITSVVATMRYEFACAHAPNKKDEIGLFYVTLISLAVVSTLIIAILVAFSGESFLTTLLDSRLLLYVPICAFLMGNAQLVTYYLNKGGNFKTVALIKIGQAVISGGCMVILVDHRHSGLIVGHILGLVLFLAFTLNIIKINGFVGLDSLRHLALSRKRYPLVNAPGAIVNSVYLSAFLFYSKSAFDSVLVGYYSLINRYVGAPLGMLSVSISQVFLQELSHAEYPRLVGLFFKLTITNTLIAIFFFLALLFSVDVLVPLLLGESWIGVEKYVLLFSASICVRFVVSPLSSVLTHQNNLHYGFAWQVLSLTVMLVLFLLNEIDDYWRFSTIYVIIDIALYLVYYAIIYKGLRFYEK